MAILKNSLIVAGWTAVSRVLGFARDLLIANKLGAGMASDAFFIALQLPNLLRRLLGEGAFNVAFVPLLAKEQAESQAAAKRFAEAVLGWLTLVLAVVAVLGVLAMPGIVTVLVPGWTDEPEKFDLTVALGRITFPYVMLICLAAFMGAVCNTAGRFSAYAMVPSFLNLAFIVGLFAFPVAGLEPVYAAAVSVPLGGLAQVAYMTWEMRRAGYNLRLRFPPMKHPGLKPMLIRMGPAALGVGVLQLSLLIDNFVASWVSEGAVSYLQYANRFYQFPLALIGIAVATVLLPHLSVLVGKGDGGGAGKSFSEAMVGCLTLATGATVGLLLLAPELMVTLLAHGKMAISDAHAISWAMMAFVLGLPAYISTKVTAPAFFALGDTAGPVRASAIALGINFVCNAAFVLVCMRMGRTDIAHVGIALATAIGGYTNAWMQWHWLRQKSDLRLDMRPLKKAVVRMLALAAAMSFALMAYKAVIPFDATWGLVGRVVWSGFAVALASSVFVAGVQQTGLFDVVAFIKLAKAKRNRKAAAAVQSESSDV